MAKQVNSFSELFHSSPLESYFFEGLDEIVPPCVLNTVNESMLDVPEPYPQAPMQAADPLVVADAGPSEKPKKRKRTKFTEQQKDTMREFYTVNAQPLRIQR